MAPILIDGRGMFKLGFTSMVVITIIFAGGFFTGYQRAADLYQHGSEIETLVLPGVETSLREQQTPEMTVIGENIDVDQAEQDNQQSRQDLVASVSTNSTVSGLSSDKQQVPSSENKPVSKNADQHDYTSSEVTAAEFQAESVLINNAGIAPVDIEKVKYSIQAGMYGSLINAKNMMKLLQVQQLDSYISKYINDKKEHRYNVRFGYFPDKKTAKEQLGNYKNNIKGDGYLVRFSADNIVNFEQIEKTEKTVAVEEKSRNQQSRGEGTLENAQASGASILEVNSLEANPLEVNSGELDTLSRAEILNM